MAAVSDIVDHLISRGAPRFGIIRGCTSEQIDEVSAAQGTRLPASYLEFLRIAGSSSGREHEGENVFYPNVLWLKEEAQALIRECGTPFQLPPDAVVFSMYQGGQFMFIEGEAGDDPPVFHFIEGNQEPVLIEESFTGFLENYLEHLLD